MNSRNWPGNAPILLLLAAAYVALFYLSEWLEGKRIFADEISLFFLPAAVRLLGTLLVGFWVAPALFIAVVFLTFVGAYDVAPGYVSEVMIAGATAVGGPAAVVLAARLMNLQLNLANLTPMRLLALSAACSLGNAAFFGWTLILIEPKLARDTVFTPIFVGDMIGMWVSIYALKLALEAFETLRRDGKGRR